MRPADLFRFCPHCGVTRAAASGEPALHCAGCGFTYYFNPTVAVGAILLRADDHALFIRRAKEPAKGRLAVPGGFVDIGETAETALRREIREEVNLEVGALEFLCSHTNDYHYRDVTYPVLDFFFIARALAATEAAALDGVESLCWLEPARVDLDEIAFPSIRAAVELFNARQSFPSPRS